MNVISDLKSNSIAGQVKIPLSPETCLNRDNSTSYVGLQDVVKHCPVKVADKKQAGKVFFWIHVIPNGGCLPIRKLYINEFCHRFNRRHFGRAMFDRLLICAVCHKNELKCA